MVPISGMSGIYIYNTGGYLWHVPSTFATVNTRANVFFVFLSGGISKEWRHIVSANCDFDRETTGKTWETAKIAHESHNDVRRIGGNAGAIFVLLTELGL